MCSDLSDELSSKPRYSRFISGETIDLCVPNSRAITEDGWADWFNRIEALQATSHGIYPNYEVAQFNFLESLASDKTKIVLLICDKKSNKAFGVISLQSINFQQRSAEIAISIGTTDRQFISPLASLEAMALITAHGFDELGMVRIYGGQAYPALSSWNKLLELIGYNTEGIRRKSFVRGSSVQDTALIACHLELYIKLKGSRGSLWGSTKEIRKLLKKQPERSLAQQLDEIQTQLQNQHTQYLFDGR